MLNLGLGVVLSHFHTIVLFLVQGREQPYPTRGVSHAIRATSGKELWGKETVA
jgi:hypothetical protein